MSRVSSWLPLQVVSSSHTDISQLNEDLKEGVVHVVIDDYMKVLTNKTLGIMLPGVEHVNNNAKANRLSFIHWCRSGSSRLFEIKVISQQHSRRSAQKVLSEKHQQATVVSNDPRNLFDASMVRVCYIYGISTWQNYNKVVGQYVLDSHCCCSLVSQLFILSVSTLLPSHFQQPPEGAFCLALSQIDY